MSLDPSAQPGAFDDRKPISAEEVLELRATLWSDGSISPAEADRLFELNAGAAPSNEWTGFFVEALSEYLIARGTPRGYVSDDDAEWLIRSIERNGRVESQAELELIVKLLEHAAYVPQSLKRFALAEIEKIVVTGSGSTRGGGDLAPKRIDDAEVALLRRLFFAPAGDGPAKVSRSEAELLFRLKEATLNADNGKDWQRLFVQGVANHLMAHQAFVPPSPEEEARLEQPYKADPWGHVLSRLDHEAPDFEGALHREHEADRVRALESAVTQDAAVTNEESDWLERLFERDGARDPMEQALLDFLAEDRTRAP